MAAAEETSRAGLLVEDSGGMDTEWKIVGGKARMSCTAIVSYIEPGPLQKKSRDWRVVILD